MTKIIPLFTARLFSLHDAEALLPALRRMTDQAALRVEQIREQLRFVPRSEPLFQRLSREMEVEVERWAEKVGKLGCHPKSLWVVAFGSNDGASYIWRYGEEGLHLFHHPSRGLDGLPPS